MTHQIYGILNKVVTLDDVAPFKKKKYSTVYEDQKEHIGKEFQILRSLNSDEVDLECAPMFKIKLEDGVEIDAYIEEIFNEDSFFTLISVADNLFRPE